MSDRVLIQNSLLVVLSALELSCIGNIILTYLMNVMFVYFNNVHIIKLQYSNNINSRTIINNLKREIKVEQNFFRNKFSVTFCNLSLIMICYNWIDLKNS